MKHSFPLLFSFLIINASSNELRRGNLLNFKGQLRNVINSKFIKSIALKKNVERVQDNILMDLNVDLALPKPKLLRPLFGSPLKNYECYTEDKYGWPIVVLKENLHCELCYSIAYRDGIQDLLTDRLQLQLSTKGHAILQTDEISEFEENFMVDAKRFTDETLNNLKPCKGIQQSIEAVYSHLKNTFESIVKAAVIKI